MIQRQTNLSANVISFCRFLRDNDFTIGINEERDALLALEVVDPFESPEVLQLCLQTALCRSPRQLRMFPNLYRTYWRELDRAVDSKVKEELEEKKKPKLATSTQTAPSIQALRNWLHGNSDNETTETSNYSALGTGSKSVYPTFDEKEMREIFFLVKKLVRKIANRRSRRYQTSYKHGQLDIKKTIRKNIVRNAEISEIIFRQKKKDNIKVVLICDVSKSMELYSRFFIQFMYAFQDLFPKVKTFVFSTSLHPISDELNKKSLDSSLEDIIRKVNNWSGGTKIGASLEQFNQQYAHRYLTSKTLTIILSDGWDTGEVELIEKNMRHIYRRSLKTLWLNPLAGHADWKPEVKGMKAALPYIDALLPFYSVESLKDVVRDLKI